MPPPTYDHAYYVGFSDDSAEIEISVPSGKLNFRAAREMAEFMLAMLMSVNH